MLQETANEISQLLPMSEADFLILLILIDGECHGYGIVKEIVRRTGGKTHLLPGNLYAMLRRLGRHGLIDQSNRKPVDDSQDRRRRYYRVTDFGRQVACAEAERMKSLVRAAEASELIGSAAR